LHDNHGERDEHLPMGKGGIDFSPVTDFLRKGKSLPIITLEPHEEKALWLSLAYLKDLFNQLETK